MPTTVIARYALVSTGSRVRSKQDTHASSFELRCVVDTVDGEAAALIEIEVRLHVAQVELSLLGRVGASEQLIENMKVSLSLCLRYNAGLSRMLNYVTLYQSLAYLLQQICLLQLAKNGITLSSLTVRNSSTDGISRVIKLNFKVFALISVIKLRAASNRDLRICWSCCFALSSRFRMPPRQDWIPKFVL